MKKRSRQHWFVDFRLPGSLAILHPARRRDNLSTQTHTHTYTHTQTYTHTHKHTRTHIHTHTHRHTHTQTFAQPANQGSAAAGVTQLEHATLAVVHWVLGGAHTATQFAFAFCPVLRSQNAAAFVGRIRSFGHLRRWLFWIWICLCVCVCIEKRQRQRARERKKEREIDAERD
jgi:hypothetical protein